MLKWVGRVFGFLLLLVVLLVGLVFVLPAERVAQIAADQLKNATGREVVISGDVSLSLWPVLGAKVGAVEVGNADWASGGPMLRAEQAAIGIDASALWRGEIAIRNIEATRPTIRLESRADGRANWEFSDASGAAQIETSTGPESAQQAFSIAMLQITDATLIYDAEGSDRVRYDGVDLTLDWPEREGGAALKGTLRPRGKPVTLSAQFDRFDRFLAGEARSVDVSLKAASGSARLVGKASLAGDVAGQLDVNMPSTDGFFSALGLPAPGLPQGLGRAVVLKTKLDLSSQRNLSLRDLVADLGGNRISGQLDASLNGVPQITAQLDAGDLDLRSAMGEEGGGGAAPSNGGQGGASGWSKEPIDASGLAAFNGVIDLNAKSIDLGSMKLGATRARLTNERSRMVFSLRDVQAYEGRIQGEFVINNRNGLSVGGNMSGSAISLSPLLGDLMGVTRLNGAAEAQVQFLGVGQSVHAIMHSLSGKGSVKTGRGTIEGINLDALMRSGDAAGGTTIFDSLSASYTIEGGVLRNSDLKLLLQIFEAGGEGTIGLGAQDIDYLFTPRLLEVNEGRDLAIPVRIHGPWAAPRIVPDLSAALQQNLEPEIEELKDQVDERVKEEVQEALGVSAQEGQSVQEAVEEKLKDELENKLKEEVGDKLLRRLFD